MVMHHASLALAFINHRIVEAQLNSHGHVYQWHVPLWFDYGHWYRMRPDTYYLAFIFSLLVTYFSHIAMYDMYELLPIIHNDYGLGNDYWYWFKWDELLGLLAIRAHILFDISKWPYAYHTKGRLSQNSWYIYTPLLMKIDWFPLTLAVIINTFISYYIPE